MEKVTAGHDALGEFAPKFAELNDDVLFGQIWAREEKMKLTDQKRKDFRIYRLLII